MEKMLFIRCSLLIFLLAGSLQLQANILPQCANENVNQCAGDLMLQHLTYNFERNNYLIPEVLGSLYLYDHSIALSHITDLPDDIALSSEEYRKAALSLQLLKEKKIDGSNSYRKAITNADAKIWYMQKAVKNYYLSKNEHEATKVLDALYITFKPAYLKALYSKLEYLITIKVFDKARSLARYLINHDLTIHHLEIHRLAYVVLFFMNIVYLYCINARTRGC